MERNLNINEKVKFVISKTLGIEMDKIQDNDVIEDICVDSIQIFSLIIALEKEFDKKARYTDLMDIVTVEDIVKYLQKS